MAPLAYALHVCAWVCLGTQVSKVATGYRVAILMHSPGLTETLCVACLWAGEAHAGTFPSFDSTPRTVKKFQDSLTTAFLERTALLLADTTSVVGGTGMFLVTDHDRVQR